jgi:phosphatidylglycerophosphatase A
LSAASQGGGDGGGGASGLDRLAILLATGFGVGKAPAAPGTWGSLLGFPLAVLIRSVALHASEAAGGSVIVAVLAGGGVWGVAIAIGYWATARTERVLAVHDDQTIVMDEILGQAIAAAVVPIGFFPYLLAFGFFRLLDITKPLFIGTIDAKVEGAWGTLGDDLLAGAIVALALAWVPWHLVSSIIPAFFSQWT